MITQRESDDILYIDFSDFEDWESFEKIVALLKKEFLLDIIEKNDGPESRVWKMKLNDVPVSLHNNPYGNYLKAATPDSIDYLKNIFPLLKDVFY